MNLIKKAWNSVCAFASSAKTKVLQLFGVSTVGGVAMQSQDAFAVPPTTIAELTAGISFADVSLGVLAVAALLTTVYVGWRAAKFVIHAVKGL